MGENSNSPEKGKESYRQEIEEGRIIGNTHLLTLGLIGNEGGEEIDDATENNLHAIKNLGVISIEGAQNPTLQ